jgi:subtilase family serine protease
MFNPGLNRCFAAWQSGFARKVKTKTLIAVVVLAASAVLSAPIPGVVQQQVLNSRVLSITKRLAPVRRLDSGTHLYLSIGLPLRNREELTNLLEDIYNPSSLNFHHYLTPDQFASRFGPSEADYQKVIDFAKSHGLMVKGTHPNRTLLDVEGSVANIEKAFHVHMLVYQHPGETRTFFAPDAEPSLNLGTPVLTINGLNNYVRPRPRMHPHLSGLSLQPMVKPLGGGGSGGGGGGGSDSGPFEGYDFRDAYAAGVSQDGTGQSVGLFELFDFSQQDIQDYEDECGIYPYVTVESVPIDGGPGNPANVDWVDYPGYLNYSFEVTGDIEQAISMAPGLSSVLVYEGPTPQDVPPLGTNYVQDAATTAQINDVLNRMATDDLAKQLSCSYGFDINLSTVQIFQQFAAQGQSFFQASGDAGAYASAVDEPSDDPYITVVGGTTLTTTSNGDWAAETAWLTPAGDDGYGDSVPQEATGGGVSRTYAIPSWQQGISMTANQGSTTMRNLPDVSIVANNIDLVWGNDFIGASSDFTEGGTSLAAPLWAGFMALVNQQAAADGLPPIGFVNPALYAIGKSTNYQSCFHDITTGMDTNSTSPAKYYAVAGYDLCTGWGTMIGSNLLQALLAPPSDRLVVTPPFGFTSFGPGDGPYSVTSQTYTLKNIGSVPLNWSLVNTSSWFTVSSTSGNLSAGASTTVTVSLNSAANSFLIGNHSGNVTIANQTDGMFQNRQFNLYVGNGGFETGDLTDWTLVGSSELVFALAGDDADVAGEEALPGQPDEQFVHSGLYGAYLGEYAWNGYPAVGSLSQTVATSPGQQYLVSFWLTCVPDSQGVTTNNEFTAQWNNLTLYAQTNLDAFGWTNLEFVVPATTTSTTLEFDFNNDPGAFGLDDVTVEPVPAPVLNTAVISGGNLTFSWNAFMNVLYVIQSTTNLDGSSWINLGSSILATNDVMNVSIPVGNAPVEFYRVAISPQ